MALKNSFINKHPLLKFTRTFLVWSFLFYLRFFARIALLFFHGTSIGIAGAVGKSTTRNALAAILSAQKPTHIVAGNSETGIPLGILNLSIGKYTLTDFFKILVLTPFHILSLRSYEYLIVEMGIDGPNPPKNMEYLLTIIKPDIGILLNESPAHVANYETLMGTGSVTERLDRVVAYMTQDDGTLLQQSSIRMAIINTENASIARFSDSLPRQIVRTVGKGKENDISLTFHEITEEGTTFEYSVHTFQIKEDLILKFPGMVLPEDTSTAIAAAILTAVSLNIPMNHISSSLQSSFTLPPGRGTIFKGIRESTIFDSSYNISSASVLSFIHSMKQIKQKTRRPTVFVFGDMKELGSFSGYEHELVARELPESIDHLILVGPLTKELVLPFVAKHEKKFKTLIHLANSHEAGEYLQQHLPEKSIVLFKGSQLLEEAIKYILVDRSDEKKLCRQDTFWKSAKKKNGTWTSHSN